MFHIQHASGTLASWQPIFLPDPAFLIETKGNPDIASPNTFLRMDTTGYIGLFTVKTNQSYELQLSSFYIHIQHFLTALL